MALRSTSPQRLDIRHFLTVKRTRSAIEVDLLMRDRHRLLLDPKLTVLLRLQRLLCGNSARNRGTARATALGRTSPFPGETGKVRCRRNPAVHHGIGEGRQPFPLRTLDGPRLAGVKIRKVEPELRRWAPGVELPAAGSLRCVARQRRDDDQRHCLGGRGNDFSP